MPARQISKGQATGALVLGIIEIMVGIVVTTCSIVLASKAKINIILTPYWAGLPYLAPGILGVITGLTKGHCVMISNMVVNIIVFILQGVASILIGVVVIVWAAYADGTCTKVGSDTCFCRASNGNTVRVRGISSCDVIQDISSLLYVLVAFLITAAVITLASSILGCVAICCSINFAHSGVVIQRPAAAQSKPPSYPQFEKQLSN